MSQFLKLKGFADTARCTITQHSDSAVGTGKNMNEEQANALDRATLVADPRNGGDLTEARKVLEDVGWKVYRA